MPAAVPLQLTEFDPPAVFPDIAWLVEALTRRDWPAVSRFFAELPGQADESDYSYAVAVVGEVPGVEHLLEAVAAHDPSVTLPSVLLAGRYIAMGSEARSDRPASQVSRQQFAVFHDLFRRAERILIGITAREPDNAAAWALRLLTVRGLELGQSEARRRYDRLTEYHPHHFVGQARLLQQLCPKWGGDWDEMHGFARSCMLAAPPGSLSPVLVAEGYLDRWADLGGGARGTAFLRQQLNIWNELGEAAERSVLHPAFRSRYTWVSVHGVFAALYSILGAPTKAAVHFRALGNVASDYPWSYLGDKRQVFERYRRTALAAG